MGVRLEWRLDSARLHSPPVDRVEPGVDFHLGKREMEKYFIIVGFLGKIPDQYRDIWNFLLQNTEGISI